MFEEIKYLIENFWGFYLNGIYITLVIALFGTAFGVILGAILAALRTVHIHHKDPKYIKVLKVVVSKLVAFYIFVVRGTPMMVQAVIFYYSIASGALSPVVTGIIIIAFNSAAYISEIFRGGIDSIDPGQLEASRSLGLSYYKSMRTVIMPQVFKNTMPSLMNMLILNVKDTSVLSVIGVSELFNQAKAAASENYFQTSTYVLVALIYLLLIYILTKIIDAVMKKERVSVDLSNQDIGGEIV